MSYGFGHNLKISPLKCLKRLGYDVSYSGDRILWHFTTSQFASLTESADPEEEARTRISYFDPEDLPDWMRRGLLKAVSQELGYQVTDFEEAKASALFERFKKSWDEMCHAEWETFVWSEYEEAFDYAGHLHDEPNGIEYGLDRSAPDDAIVTIVMPKSLLMGKWPDIVEELKDFTTDRPVREFLLLNIVQFPFNAMDLGDRWGDYLVTSSGGGMQYVIESITREFSDIFDEAPRTDAPGQTSLAFGGE